MSKSNTSISCLSTSLQIFSFMIVDWIRRNEELASSQMAGMSPSQVIRQAVRMTSHRRLCLVFHWERWRKKMWKTERKIYFMLGQTPLRFYSSEKPTTRLAIKSWNTGSTKRLHTGALSTIQQRCHVRYFHKHYPNK